MLKPKRKNHVAEFTPAQRLVPTILLVLLFALGLVILIEREIWYLASYALLWIGSYPVIYAGTCRYCANYGKPCPVVLEGGMVHRFFNRSDKPFGMMQLAWASFAYVMRIAVPVIVIVQDRLWTWGIVFGVIFIGFWILHFRVTACPNCVNYSCMMNPGNR